MGEGPSSSRRPWRAIAAATTALLLWLLVGVIGLGTVLQMRQRAKLPDFSHYYAGAYTLRHGLDPYTTDFRPLASRLGLDLDVLRHAGYPPTFILLFEPLTLLTPEKAYWTWSAINLALLFWSLGLLLGGQKPLGRPWNYTFWALALLYRPVSLNFCNAQTQVMLLFLLAAAMRLAEREPLGTPASASGWLSRQAGRDLAAGCLLGVAGLLKAFPLVVIGAFVLGRRWRVVASALGAIFVGLCLTAALVGVRESLDFLRVIPSLADKQWLGLPTNVSINGFVTRLLLSRHLAGAGLPVGGVGQRLIVLAATALLVALTTVLTARSGNRESLSPSLGLWVTTAVLISPTAWHHYEVLLLIPFAQALNEAIRRGSLSSAALAAAASYGLTEATWLWFAFEGRHGSGWLAPVLNEGFFVSLVLGYAAAALLVLEAGSQATVERGCHSERSLRSEESTCSDLPAAAAQAGGFATPLQDKSLRVDPSLHSG